MIQSSVLLVAEYRLAADALTRATNIKLPSRSLIRQATKDRGMEDMAGYDLVVLIPASSDRRWIGCITRASEAGVPMMLVASEDGAMRHIIDAAKINGASLMLEPQGIDDIAAAIEQFSQP